MSSLADSMQVIREVDVTGDGKIFKKVYEEGSGDVVGNGVKVDVHYRGTFDDGSQFDCSYSKDPLSFTTGAGQVIKGWDQGVATMKKGEKAALAIHSDYGYGDNGHPPIIPAKATLHFDVNLVNF